MSTKSLIEYMLNNDASAFSEELDKILKTKIMEKMEKDDQEDESEDEDDDEDDDE